MDLYQLQISNPDAFRQFAVKDILFLYCKCPQKEKILQLHSTYNQLVVSLAGGRKSLQGPHFGLGRVPIRSSTRARRIRNSC